MNIKPDYDHRKEILNEISASKKQTGGHVYIWGCSLMAPRILNDLKTIADVDPEGFIVDDRYVTSETYLGLPILKRSTWEAYSGQNDQIVIGFTNEYAAQELIKQRPKNCKYYQLIYPFQGSVDSTIDSSFYIEHKPEFEQVYENLADEESKTVMQLFIQACISGDVSALNNHIYQGQYFNGLTSNTFEGDFIDLGAYTGDTAIDAIQFFKDKLGRVISFEPDIQNANKYRTYMQEHPEYNDRWILIEKGSWKEKDVLFFSSADSSSNISESGNISIQVDSVDNVLRDLTPRNKIGYIKMDVEGSEKESLIGCKKTIISDHPILAVCVYHKPDDLFTLLNTIRSIDTDNTYKYYLRYHGTYLRELVLYAI